MSKAEVTGSLIANSTDARRYYRFTLDGSITSDEAFGMTIDVMYHTRTPDSYSEAYMVDMMSDLMSNSVSGCEDIRPAFELEL